MTQDPKVNPGIPSTRSPRRAPRPDRELAQVHAIGQRVGAPSRLGKRAVACRIAGMVATLPSSFAIVWTSVGGY